MTKITISRILIALAVLAGLISAWQTLQFTWMPEFQAPALLDGPTHTNYHAFREAMLAFAVNGLMIWAIIKGAVQRFGTWATTLFMAVFYYIGWWLAWPIWGYHAPELGAEIVHAVATVAGLVGLYLLKPAAESLHQA